MLEHNRVYTAGASSKNIDLLDKNIKVIKTNRGGKHTCHGPGQKVVYFVLNLNKREKDIRKLVNKLERCIMDILNEYKIESYPDRKNIGIWVREKNKQMKIAAIGIKVKRWVAYHGFALNVKNDLKMYNGIVPCGIHNRAVVSLESILERAVLTEEVSTSVLHHLGEVFHMSFEETNLSNLLQKI